jgi:hypothetical protein
MPNGEGIRGVMGYRSMVIRRFIPGFAIIGVLALALAACGGDDRPSFESWQPEWEALVSGFPTYEELGDPPDRAVCAETLSELRTSASTVSPTPDFSLDAPVRAWVSIAESIAFECPPQSTTLPDLDYAYRELDRIEAEVDAVLDGLAGE